MCNQACYTANCMGFCSGGNSVMCKKVLKTNGFRHFNRLISSFPASATPNEVDRNYDTVRKRVWISEWVVMSCQIQPRSQCHCCFSSGLVRSFRWQKNKQKNKPKLAKECSRQGGKIKTWSVEMFLKWRHLSPILHYAANVIERVRSGKFKALFYGKKHRTKFFGLNTCLDVIEMPKPQKPCWSYGHFNDRGEWGEVWYLFINF